MKRVAWIDSLRGFAMILIVLGHALPMGSLKVFLYAFHVPLFFWLSGMVFLAKGSFRDFVAGKARRLLVPYLAAGLLSALVYAVAGDVAISAIGRNGMDSSLPRSIAGLLYGSGKCNLMDFNLPLWFLPCMFSECVIAFLVLRAANKLPAGKIRYVFPVFVAVCMGTMANIYSKVSGAPPLPLGLETAFAMFPFFTLGWIMSDDHVLDGHETLTLWQRVISFVLLLVGMSTVFLNARNGIVDYVSDAYRNIALFYIGAICLTTFLIVTFSSLPALSMCVGLGYIGRHTMPILLMHKFPIVLIQIIVRRIGSSVALTGAFDFVVALVSTAASIAGCLYIAQHMPQKARWVIGEETKDAT